MSQTVFALHEESGVVAEIDAEWLDHPTFGPLLRQMRTGKPVIDLTAPPKPAPTVDDTDPSDEDTDPDEDVE